MAAELFLFPFPTALDANAIVVPGAKLYFYLTGTTTPTPVYSDSGLTTPLTNPVVANSAGIWPQIYYDTTVTYRVILTDANGVELGDPVDPYIPGVMGSISPALQALYDDTVAEATAAAASASDAADSFTSTTRLIAGNPVILGAEIYNSPAVEGEWPLTLYAPFTGTVSQIVTQDLGAGGGSYDITVLVNDVPEYTDTITPSSDLVTADPGISIALGDKVTVLFDTFTGTVSNIGFSMFVQPTALGSVPGMSGDITTNSDFTMATDKLLGRDTAGTGAIEQIGIGTGLEISGGNLNVTSGATWNVFDTQTTTSGTTATFTLPAGTNDLMFAMEGISHSDTGGARYPQIRLQWSDSSYTTAANCTPGTLNFNQTMHAQVRLTNVPASPLYWEGRGVVSPANKGVTSVAAAGGQLARHDSGTTLIAVEFSWSSGATFDAGTITGYYR